MAQRKPLRPAADRILAVEHEADRLVDGWLPAGILFLQVQPQHEDGRVGGRLIVERRVAVVVLELFEPPRVPAHGRIPIAQAPIAREIDDIVPAAARMLAPHERPAHLRGRAVVVLVTGRVVRIQEQVPHAGSAGRLQPDHCLACLHLAPAARKVR
jgi:hypothetical protein